MLMLANWVPSVMSTFDRHPDLMLLMEFNLLQIKLCTMRLEVVQYTIVYTRLHVEYD